MSFEVKERLAKQYGSSPPQLNKLRMLDLIFYNPSDNPMSQPSKKADQKKSDGTNKKSQSTSGSDSDSDPDEPSGEKDTKASSDGSDSKVASSIPVPQVRIGDEGQVILAPESLVMKKKEAEVMDSPVVEEFSFSDSNKKRASLDRTAWSYEDSLKFYKALHSLGTDFSMMTELFPNRTRGNLKAKFKREERRNPGLIDKVLAAQGQTLNIAEVEKDLGADKTLKRFCNECLVTPPEYRKRCEKKSWVKNANTVLLKCNPCAPTESKGGATSSETSEGGTKDSNDLGASKVNEKTENNEDAIFKRPSNVHPPRKRRTVRSTPVVPEKRRKGESLDGSRTQDANKGEDAVFKKPRIPRKRKVIPSKKSDPPGPKTHLLSISQDEDDASDDTDDSTSQDTAEDECFVIKTNVKGRSFSYSQSVKVNFADPEVPIDVNETIEHDRPQTPMSETSSDVGLDTEIESDSEGGEVVEVVSIDVSEIASYLESTGAVIIESSIESDPLEGPPIALPPMESMSD